MLCLASQSPAQDTVNEAASFDPTKITAFKLHPCAMAPARSGSLQLSSCQYCFCTVSHPLPMSFERCMQHGANLDGVILAVD